MSKQSKSKKTWFSPLKSGYKPSFFIFTRSLFKKINRKFYNQVSHLKK